MKSLIRTLVLLLSFTPIFLYDSARAYPVKLLHMEYKDPHYTKHVFLVGDVHCRASEKSQEGIKVIEHSGRFFELLGSSSRGQRSLPVLWEIAASEASYDKSRLYMHRQAKKLSKMHKNKKSRLVVTPSDTLRKISPLLRKLMYLALAKPGIAKAKLKSNGFRLKVSQSLERIFLPKSGNLLEKRLFQTSNQQSLPRHITASLNQNLKWHRQQIIRLRQNLSYPPNRIFAENLVDELKINLSRNTADLEFLVNIFSNNSKIIMVYAGNGHIRRLQKFLYKLDFKASFEIENGHYLSKSAFEAFGLNLKDSVNLIEKHSPSSFLENIPYITI
ncbi:MAG: hypothetical protein AB8G05_21955 [Oligoflexales bacterium]